MNLYKKDGEWWKIPYVHGQESNVTTVAQTAHLTKSIDTTLEIIKQSMLKDPKLFIDLRARSGLLNFKEHAHFRDSIEMLNLFKSMKRIQHINSDKIQLSKLEQAGLNFDRDVVNKQLMIL